MKTQVKQLLIALVILSTVNLKPSTVLAQGTVFTYQGQLQNNGGPANGTYDMTFTLFSALSGGLAVAGPVTNTTIAVSNGMFSVKIDFGADVWNGETNWLEVGVSTNGVGSFTTLTPRQQVTPTPYAIAARIVTGPINASNIQSGAITAAQIAGKQVVTSLNGLRDAVSLQAGANVTLSTNVNTNSITISAVGGGGANGWLLTGNAGTAAGINFVGTTDLQPLELHINGNRAMRLEPGTGRAAPNVIGGSPDNAAGAGVGGAAIGGGDDNTIYGSYSTISGGGLNGVSGQYSTIGGGNYNVIPVGDDYSTIGGGQHNAVNAKNSTISGGLQNAIFAQYSIVSGGYSNIIGGDGFATIAGGLQNAVNGEYSTVGGGYLNAIDASAYSSTISGGNGNGIMPGGSYSAIGGGQFNAINTSYATVGGGWSNTIASSSLQSTIAGGELNAIGTNCPVSTIGGGDFNSVINFATYATIGGGYSNTIGSFDSYATIGGGSGNYNGGFNSTIGGGSANVISNNDCTIAGGIQNVISGGQYSTIAGGQANSIQNAYATVAGGLANTNGADYATIGGGGANTAGANSHYAVIGGGAANTISNSSPFTFIGGGRLNSIGTNSQGACNLGGQQNVIGAGAPYSVIAGGTGNVIDPNAGGSFVAGTYAEAMHGGSFVWSCGVPIVTTGPDQFLIEAIGGVGINKSVSTNNPSNPDVSLDVRGGINADGEISAQTMQVTSVFSCGGNITAQGSICANGGLSCVSDRNAKEHLESIDPADALQKIARLPVSRWNYKTDPHTSHIGPMAQDFYAAFNVGPDDKHISVLDEGGVALVAIQGLNQKLNEKDAEIQELKARMEKLEQLMSQKSGGAQ